MVTKDEIKHLGWLSRMELSDDELDRYTSQIEQIIAYLDTLDQIELEKVEPIKTRKKFAELRPDEAQAFGKDVLGTPNRKDGFVKGPRMV
jgi:aspartyl-tRNA(Asn)/glutamyl-tRNA(Gln) amidotransferase subunit C